MGRQLVVCPNCSRCAKLRLWIRRPHILSCGACGYVKENPRGCPLWLRVPCCGRTLYATGPRHLNLLADYISAPLRERLYLNWADREYLRTLPRWMCLAKNREAVMRAVGVLRRKLLDA